MTNETEDWGEAAEARILDAALPRAAMLGWSIRVAALARVESAMADAAATRSWTGFLALPTNIPLGLRLAWASADVLWRWAGDTATDENHYSKRVLLAEILISTLAIRLAGGAEAAETQLDRRIAGVMTFEKWKSRVGLGDVAATVAGALGRLRYGSARI
jgi:ubiquinone biosynthesis protein COQ9